jgi:hypothetical protein
MRKWLQSQQEDIIWMTVSTAIFTRIHQNTGDMFLNDVTSGFHLFRVLICLSITPSLFPMCSQFGPSALDTVCHS